MRGGICAHYGRIQKLECFMENIWYLKKYCLDRSKSPFLTWRDSINYTTVLFNSRVVYINDEDITEVADDSGANELEVDYLENDFIAKTGIVGKCRNKRPFPFLSLFFKTTFQEFEVCCNLITLFYEF